MAKPKKLPATAPQEPVVEPSVRVFTRWTPQVIQSAEIAADGGDLTQAARVVTWLLTDDRIRGCLNARIQALLGLVPGFEKSGDRRRAGTAIKALEAGEDFWASYPETELWLMLAWGLMLGVAPMRHQPRFDEDHGGRLLPCPEFWHPAAGLKQDRQTGEWKIRVATPGNPYGTEETIVAGDGTWVLHTPYGKHRPWDLGLWKQLCWWKLLKDYGRSDWARNMEKGSLLVLTQTVVQQNAPGQLANTQAQRDASASSLYQRGKDAVASLPVGADLKLVETGGKAQDLYNSGVQAADEAFAIAIRGGNLTTSVEGGSKAAAEVQERTGDFVNLRFDAETTSATLHDQSLVWWALWNYGDRKLAPWPDYPVAPQRNLKNFAETITAFNKACKELEANGFEVDRQSMLEEFELQEFVLPGEKPETVVTPVVEPANDTEPETKAPKSPEQQARAVVAVASRESDPLLDAIASAPRTVIVGGPRAGKTTLAVRASERFKRQVRHADDLMNELEFEAAGDAVAGWLDEEGDAIIEGVAAACGLRAWLDAKPGKALGWSVVMLALPKVPLSKGQASMAAGVQTVWDEILPELRARNTTITIEDEQN